MRSFRSVIDIIRVCHVIKCFGNDDVRCRTATSFYYFCNYNLCLWSNSFYRTVSSNNTRNMCSVALAIHWIVIVVTKVITCRNLCRWEGNTRISAKIRMGIINTCINNPHTHPGTVNTWICPHTSTSSTNQWIAVLIDWFIKMLNVNHAPLKAIVVNTSNVFISSKILVHCTNVFNAYIYSNTVVRNIHVVNILKYNTCSK